MQASSTIPLTNFKATASSTAPVSVGHACSHDIVVSLTYASGWLDSTAAVLCWSLEHKPPGFSIVVKHLHGLLNNMMDLMMPVVPSYSFQEPTRITPAQARLLRIMFQVSREYMQYLSSPAAARSHPFKMIQQHFDDLCAAQDAALSRVQKTARYEDSASRESGAEPYNLELRQLLTSPELVDTASLKLAGWCQYHYKQQGRQKGQEHGHQGMGSARNNSSGRSAATSSTSS